MKLVVFGLTISSSWGNGHATLWRALCRALQADGHHVVFFERDVPYYAAHRDLHELPGGTLLIYGSWDAVRGRAERELAQADAALVTSYCPDARAAAAALLGHCPGVRGFYDLDTPITLERLSRGLAVDYLPVDGLGAFDLVLSYTGGAALEALRERLGARRAAPLYGSVDPQLHRPAEPAPEFAADLSYLGTYAPDRQAALEELFLGPARARPGARFLIGGAQYPQSFPWAPNVYFVHHVAPARHPAFFASARLTLNVTREAMAELGHCPSGRLFEAAACGAAIVSDAWSGLEEFFEPDVELLVARSRHEVLAALERAPAELARIGAAARARTLGAHTATQRAAELVALLESARPGRRAADTARCDGPHAAAASPAL